MIRLLTGQWLATAYVAIVTALLFFALGRILGPEKFGVFSYVHSFSLIYFIFQDGGFRTMIFRESASQSIGFPPVRELLPQALGHLVGATLFGMVLLLVLPLPYKMAIAAALICAAGVVCVNLVSALLKGEGDFIKEALWQVQVRTLSGGMIIAGLLVCRDSVSGVFWFWAGGLFLVLLLPVARQKLMWPNFKWNCSLYKLVVFFLLIDAATVLYFRIDMLVLQYLGVGSAEIGNYAAAYRVLSAALLFMTPVAHLAFKYLRGQFSEPKKFAYNLCFMMLASLGVALVLCLFGRHFAQDIILLAFGSKFIQAVPFLGLLLVALVFMMPNFILTQAMIACHEEKYYAGCAICGVVLNLVLNFTLIPRQGAAGAALATVVTELFLLLGLGGRILIRFH